MDRTRHGPPIPFALGPIATDRVRGASALARSAVLQLEKWAASTPLEGVDGARRLAHASRVFRQAQPAMGAFRRWALLLDEVRARPRGRRGRLLRCARSELRRLRTETARVAHAAAGILPPDAVFLTLSRSETVAGALGKAPRSRQAAHVFVLESLPGAEGIDQARDLRRSGVPASVIRDAEGPTTVRGVDALLLGADAVFEDGTVWHKVGTRGLVVAARAAGVPVVVLAGTSKRVPGAAPRRPPSDLFDATPGRWVSLLVTEDGPVRAARSGGGRASRP